jgi:hypothetical protein
LKSTIFLPVNAKLGWSDINMLAVVLISFFLSSYWSAGLGTFLQAPAFASHWLRDFAICTATTGENYQYNATHLRHLRQANQLLSLVNNTLHVIIYGQQKVFVEAKQNI